MSVTPIVYFQISNFVPIWNLFPGRTSAEKVSFERFSRKNISPCVSIHFESSFFVKGVVLSIIRERRTRESLKNITRLSGICISISQKVDSASIAQVYLLIVIIFASWAGCAASCAISSSGRLYR